MPTMEEKILIARGPDEIFARLAQPERGPEWTPNLVRVERTSEVEAGPGLETRLVARLAGRDVAGTGRCEAWDPPQRLVLSSELEVGVSSTTTFTLAARGASTELTARLDYTLSGSGVAKLVGGLVGEALARRDLRKALRTLKTQLEADRPDAPRRPS